MGSPLRPLPMKFCTEIENSDVGSFPKSTMILLDIDIPEEKTSTKTSNDEGDFITVTGTKRARRQSRKAPRPLVSWPLTIQSDIN